jgi:deoxyadenosine/deoxycytidine kinase
LIAVCGMIGVGKTTYVSALAEHLASEAFYEASDQNPVLAKFYANPVEYGFMSQVYYLATGFAATKKASEYNRFLLDRSLMEHILFGEVNHDLGRITADEKVVYDTLAENLMEQAKAFPGKNLYIYLQASFETILKRIAMRDRSFEQDPALKEYYKTLHTRYDSWVKAHVTPNELLIINTDKYDIMKPEQKQEIFNIINLKMQALGL